MTIQESSKTSNGVKKFLPIVIIILLIAGAAFFGGMKYGQSKNSSRRFSGQNMGTGGPANGRAGNQAGGGLTSGEIISKDDPAKDGAGKSINVKLQNGSSKIVFYSDTTEVGKFVNGISSDLEIGKSVMITGTTNSDGSITAKSIQLRPSM